MTVIINDDLVLDQWTPIAWYERKMYTPRKCGDGADWKRTIRIYDNAPLQLGEAEKLWK